jgi:hypothetical protein
MSYEEWHWRLFNVLARAFGLLSVCAGVAFAATFVFSSWRPDAEERVLTVSGAPGIDFAFAAAFCLVMGVLFVMVQPYRPDVSGEDASRGVGGPASRRESECTLGAAP